MECLLLYRNQQADISCGTWKDGQILPDSKAQSGHNIGAFAQYATSQGEQIEVKFGVSYIDMDQAKQNLEREIPGWNFDQTKSRGRQVWNGTLDKIQVEGGTEKERTIFYSALYRVMLGSESQDITEIQ